MQSMTQQSLAGMTALRQNRSFTCNCASLAYLVGLKEIEL
jgi:hypothetical protein